MRKGVHGCTEGNLGHDYVIGKGVIYILKERGDIAILRERGDMDVLREGGTWLY